MDPQIVDVVKAAGATVSGVAIWNAFGGKEAVLKTVGPSLDALGLELRGFTERGLANLRRVIEAARSKVQPGELGQVPPRVLNAIVNEGLFQEDQLAAEYLGGVLASSRVSDLRDDRASAWVSLLSRLTTYQIRAHYIIYMSLRLELLKNQVPMSEVRAGRKTLLLQRDSLTGALDLKESDDVTDMMAHIEHGLKREELLTEAAIDKGRPEELRIVPSVTGVSLLVWANGLGKIGTDAAFLSDKIPEIPGVRVIAGRIVARPNNAPRWG